jgi:hypothetical protein
MSVEELLNNYRGGGDDVSMPGAAIAEIMHQHRSDAEVQAAGCLALDQKICNDEFAQAPGGPVLHLMRKTDDAVRILTGMVHGSTREEHAFVHRAGILRGPYLPHRGVILDNRKRVPAYMVNEEDIVSAEKARETLDGFFRAETRINGVFRVSRRV